MSQEEVGTINIFERKRVVLDFGQIDSPTLITVFVGLYNSNKYFEGLVRQIERQRQFGVQWLIVDNDSQDDSWERALGWARKSGLNITLVRNGLNLGATGSMFSNLDLVRGEWFTAMHQDDFYSDAFLKSLVTSARACDNETVLIFGDMGRIDSKGRRLGAYPPPIWLVPELSPQTLFLALIRNHCIPWPVMTVRSEVFRSLENPWHSTSFPDTEVTLRLVAHGKFHHIPKELMSYRDNSESESRSIDSAERSFGAALGLLRVFSSDEFENIVQGVSIEDRSNFSNGLSDALVARFNGDPYQSLVQAYALEKLDQLWGHSQPQTLLSISEIYGSMGADRTSQLLKDMSNFNVTRSSVLPVAAGSWASSEGVDGSANRLRLNQFPFIVNSYEKWGWLLPYWFRKLTFTRLIRFMVRKNPKNSWNYVWRA